jgi:hypothetical protein
MKKKTKKQTDFVTCLSCGTVWMAVTRAYAEEQTKHFNGYFDTLSSGQRDDYYGNKPASVASYEKCWCSNSYKNFRKFKQGDCPDGCTISPIIRKED